MLVGHFLPFVVFSFTQNRGEKCEWGFGTLLAGKPLVVREEMVLLNKLPVDCGVGV